MISAIRTGQSEPLFHVRAVHRHSEDLLSDDVSPLNLLAGFAS